MIAALKEYGFDLATKNFPVTTESHLVQWEMVKQGIGIGFMIESVGDAEPKVNRVLPDHAAFDVEVWLVAHRELRTSRRVRTVFDHLGAALNSAD